MKKEIVEKFKDKDVRVGYTPADDLTWVNSIAGRITEIRETDFLLYVDDLLYISIDYMLTESLTLIDRSKPDPT